LSRGRHDQIRLNVACPPHALPQKWLISPARDLLVARDAATELIPKQIRHAGQIIGTDAAAADPAAPTYHHAQRAIATAAMVPSERCAAARPPWSCEARFCRGFVADCMSFWGLPYSDNPPPIAAIEDGRE
jgi:hypothetical protein